MKSVVKEARLKRKKRRSSKKRKTPYFLYLENLIDGELEFYAREFVLYLQVRNYSDSTIKVQSRNLSHFLLWAKERSLIKPEQITKPIIERYQKFLFRYRDEKGKALAFTTQKLRLTQLRGFFRYLCKKNFISYNPAYDLELPKAPRKLPRSYLSVEEAEKVLSIPDTRTELGIRDRAILETFYSTGIRRGELVNLSIYDISRDLGYLLIREGKGGKDRVVPIGERALQWIDKYLLDVRPRLAPTPDEGSLFLMISGDGFKRDILSNLVRKYIDDAKLGKSGSCHMFRHTFATVMLESGADIRYIQKMMGHANLDATEIYTHVAIKKLKQVHERMHPAKSERSKKDSETLLK